MIVPPDRPLQSQCARLFGDPSHPDFLAHVTHVQPPYQLRMGAIPVHSVKINKVAAPSLARVFAAVWEACKKDPEEIRRFNIDHFSGDWVVRLMRGRPSISMHAYALALDFDAEDNPLGRTPGYFRANHPLVQAFEENGWVWGGSWSGRPDPMHFQYATVG